MNQAYHEGHPVLRHSPEGTLVLCPFGHVIMFQPVKNWTGSWLEAKATDPNWRVRCYGAIPETVCQRIRREQRLLASGKWSHTTRNGRRLHRLAERERKQQP